MQPELKDQQMSSSIEALTIWIVNYTMVTLMTVRSGQRVLNEADKLHSSLALLYTLLRGFSEREAVCCARSACALMRRLRAAPLCVRLVARPVQASLLATVLAITTDYTIILLQFNHVV
ncbi:uncharacterized protein LOC125227815 [Leguminivora glycinivorella]|uniref:uncharacterized protein LOC125227815 n=1 Tax=Leguminivora glycinivorella TaxID=1035111 RepID=UPI00200BE653|nr:uncharacterized protein LOC125227815 [Leguminivora glycinivorella]